jgi:uncharacterized protein
MELRVLTLEATEMRVEGGGDTPRKLVGYAAVFNRKSENLGGFVEIIRPGAFRKAIESSDIRALFNHDPNFVLGRKSSGTLTVEENQKGLRFEVTPPDTQIIRDLVIAPIERGDVSGCSFSFNVAKDGDKWSEQGDMYLREVLDVSALGDVGPVTFPAYPSTNVSMRSTQDVYDSHISSLRAHEKELEIAQARARRVREVELLEIQTGGN